MRACRAFEGSACQKERHSPCEQGVHSLLFLFFSGREKSPPLSAGLRGATSFHPIPPARPHRQGHTRGRGRRGDAASSFHSNGFLHPQPPRHPTPTLPPGDGVHVQCGRHDGVPGVFVSFEMGGRGGVQRESERAATPHLAAALVSQTLTPSPPSLFSTQHHHLFPAGRFCLPGAGVRAC